MFDGSLSGWNLPIFARARELKGLQYPEDGFVTFYHRADEKSFKEVMEYLDLADYHAQLMDGLFDEEDEVPFEDRDTESIESDNE